MHRPLHSFFLHLRISEAFLIQHQLVVPGRISQYLRGPNKVTFCRRLTTISQTDRNKPYDFCVKTLTTCWCPLHLGKQFIPLHYSCLETLNLSGSPLQLPIVQRIGRWKKGHQGTSFCRFCDRMTPTNLNHSLCCFNHEILTDVSEYFSTSTINLSSFKLLTWNESNYRKKVAMGTHTSKQGARTHEKAFCQWQIQK